MQIETIAVDFGNFELKTCDGAGNTSAIRSIHYQLPRSRKPLTGHEHSPLVVMPNGDRFHLGSQATKYERYEKTVSMDKSKLARLHLYASVGRECADIRLVASHHSPDDVRTALINALKGSHIYTRNGVDCRINVRSVDVVPEGLGAYWTAKNEGLTPRDGHTVVVDIGGGSWLYRLIDSDGEIIAENVSDKLGTYSLARDVAGDQRLRDQLRAINITAPDAGVVMDGFTKSHCYALTDATWYPWLSDYRDPWFRNIMNQVKTDLQHHLPSIKRFIFTGGGAHLIKDRVNGSRGGGSVLAVMPDPNFANVVGMYLQYSPPIKLKAVA